MADINIPAAVIRVSGLPGLRGEKGDSGIYECPSTLPMEMGKAVALTSAGLVYADAASATGAIGFVKVASAANTIATIATGGTVGGFVGLVVGNPVYMATSGAVTQTKPSVGYVQVLGVAVSATEVYVQIQTAEVIPAAVVEPVRVINEAAAYTTTVDDVGYTISISAGGVTIPANEFGPGDSIFIYNDSDVAQTLLYTGVTVFLSDGSAGGTSLSMEPRCKYDVFFMSATSAVVYGYKEASVVTTPKVVSKTAAHILEASDIDLVISITEGGVTIPVDVLDPGDRVLIINDSDLPQDITSSAVTAYIEGITGAVTQVALAARGKCEVLCYGADTVLLSGNIA